MQLIIDANWTTFRSRYCNSESISTYPTPVPDEKKKRTFSVRSFHYCSKISYPDIRLIMDQDESRYHK